MELVYLWVEKYKNIDNQGFNFSPRFSCKYDDVKKELTIKENDDYIENFFGKNINVTAIVGKNGSGKSGLLHSLIEANDVFFSPVPSVEHKFIMCYMKNGDKILVTNINLNNKTEFILNNNSNPFHLIHYDSSLSYFQRYWNNKTSIMTVGNFTPYKEKENMPSYYEYINLIPNKDISLNKLDEEESKNIILYIRNPNKIIDSFFEPSAIYINSFDGKICNSCSNFEDFEIYNLKRYLIELLKKALSQIDEKELLEKTLSTYKKKQSKVTISGDFPISKIIDDLKSKNIDLREIVNIIYNQVLPPNNNFYLSSLSWEIRDNILSDIKKLREYIDISLKITNKNNLITKIKSSFQVNIDLLEESLISFILKMKPFLKVVIFDENRGISYDSLSNGEKELLRIIFYLEKIINNQKIKDEDIVILMDEVNNFLHPNWQKEVIKYLINIFEKKENNIHFILTSHSPFLLSDIPKQNIIFLDTYNDKSKEKYPNLNLDNLKEGNCINVSSEIDIKPFGANIHELLSHGFFMEDGLMGKFAENKIQNIVDFYDDVKNHKKTKDELRDSYKEKKEEFYFIRDNIGEKYIQGVITNHIEYIEERLGNDSFRTRQIKQLEAKLKLLKGIDD